MLCMHLHHRAALLKHDSGINKKDDVTAILLIGTYFRHARKPWRCMRNAVHASSPQAASLKHDSGISKKDDVTAILLIGTYFRHARKPWRCVRIVHASSPQAASLKT
jgi:hypothetical protein